MKTQTLLLAAALTLAALPAQAQEQTPFQEFIATAKDCAADATEITPAQAYEAAAQALEAEGKPDAASYWRQDPATLRNFAAPSIRRSDGNTETLREQAATFYHMEAYRFWTEAEKVRTENAAQAQRYEAIAEAWICAAQLFEAAAQ